MMKKQPTPLEILMAEQRRVRESCRVQEQKINEDFKYIHRHSGRIFFAGISSLFFSKPAEVIENNEPEERTSAIHRDDAKEFFSFIVGSSTTYSFALGNGTNR